MGKAVLKHTHSKRWRVHLTPPNLAKRLDCARFIAALSLALSTRTLP
jgi:hypothetical protein